MQQSNIGDSLVDLTKKILNNQTESFDREQQILNAVQAGGTSTGTLSTGADLICATAGTAVQGSNVAVTRGVLVVARPTNTGSIYIGGSDVTNNAGAKKGIILVQGGMPSQFIPCSNLNQLWINADNNGDKAGVVCV